jgi:hypothetical protein
MKARRYFNRCFAASLFLATFACASDVVSPPFRIGTSSNGLSLSSTTDGTGPTFIHASSDSPTIANPVVSFWAKKGDDSEARMYYHALPGSRDSTLFVDFRVEGASLAFYPDGTPFAKGDSVLITISLVDPDRLIIDCQPSGLRFSSAKPARLKMSYQHTDADTTTAALLTIWRRESLTAPWIAQASRVEFGIHEVKTDVNGFSGYAIAF